MTNPNQTANQVATQDTSIQATHSERFVKGVMDQFAAEAGTPVAFSDYEKALAQHLFLKVDSVLKELETKRLSADKPYGSPYTWPNVNMRKMGLDAVHRVHLGLDALIPNHLHPVPYFNKREKKYDIDLRVGYVGQAYYRVNSAVDTPVDVIYELVYSTDVFIPRKKSFTNEVESYDFTITNPFDRGEIIGGFGYLAYEDTRKNTLILVSEADFLKSKGAAQSKTFWTNHPVEMRYKTLVHRVTSKLIVDPKKVNAAAYVHVESQESEGDVRREVNENANTEDLDIKPEVLDAPHKEEKKVDNQTGEILNPVDAPKPTEEPITEQKDDDPF